MPKPSDHSIIGIRWDFRNKLEKNGVIIQNIVRLVVKWYNQKEEIDYDETFALVAMLEAIIILLALACSRDFNLFQMQVKRKSYLIEKN